jgi:hypothetical protein
MGYRVKKKKKMERKTCVGKEAVWGFLFSEID